MPTYTYRCQDCETAYEVFHKVREIAEDIVCPSCSSRSHVRLLSAPMIAVGSRGSSGFRDVAPENESHGPTCCGGGACGLN